MTNKEAIKEIIQGTCEGCYGSDDSNLSLCKRCGYGMAIKALADIDQYRQIGTVEEFMSLKEYFGHSEPKSRGKAIYDKAIDDFAEWIFPFTDGCDFSSKEEIKREFNQSIIKYLKGKENE